jgi:hypothetical protein
MRPVFRQGPLRLLDMLTPPYTGRPMKLMELLLRLKS